MKHAIPDDVTPPEPIQPESFIRLTIKQLYAAVFALVCGAVMATSAWLASKREMENFGAQLGGLKEYMKDEVWHVRDQKDWESQMRINNPMLKVPSAREIHSTNTIR